MNRFVLPAEPIPAAELAPLGFVTLADGAMLAQQAEAPADRLGRGPTQAYAGTKRIPAAWARGGPSFSDEVMIDFSRRPFETQDVINAASGSR